MPTPEDLQQALQDAITELQSRRALLGDATRDGIWDTAMLAFHLMDQVARSKVFPHTLANGVGTLTSVGGFLGC